MANAIDTGWLYKGVCYEEWSQAQDQLMSYTAPVFTQNPPQMHTFEKNNSVWFYRTWDMSGYRPKLIAEQPMEYNGFTRCDPKYPAEFQLQAFEMAIAAALFMFIVGAGIGMIIQVVRRARTI